MGTYYSADTSTISDAGSSLKTLSDTIKNSRQYGDAHGAEAYHEITGALGDFRDDWDNALTRLTKSIGELGETVTDAAQLYEEHDQQWSKAWSGD